MIESIINFFQDSFNQVLYNISIIVFIVISTTFLQKYHILLLNKIGNLSGKLFILISNFFTRIGVIIHEFSHIIFAFLFGQEIKKVELFKSTGGSVRIGNKDYIGAIGHFKGSGFLFFIFLVINRLGIFLTSIGPLLVGITISFLLINYVFAMPLFGIETNFENYNLSEISFYDTLLIIIFSVFFIQGFILSWKDIKNLVIYQGYNIFEKFIAGIINLFFLFILLFIASFFYMYFVFFGIIYTFSFILLLLIYILALLINTIFKK